MRTPLVGEETRQAINWEPDRLVWPYIQGLPAMVAGSNTDGLSTGGILSGDQELLLSPGTLQSSGQGQSCPWGHPGWNNSSLQRTE